MRFQAQKEGPLVGQRIPADGGGVSPNRRPQESVRRRSDRRQPVEFQFQGNGGVARTHQLGKVCRAGDNIAASNDPDFPAAAAVLEAKNGIDAGVIFGGIDLSGNHLPGRRQRPGGAALDLA